MKTKILTLITSLLMVSCISNKSEVAKESTIKLANANLYYKAIGQGEPIIVIHGGPGLDSSYLEPQMYELTNKYKVILFDQRGAGKSLPAEISSKTINIKTFVDDIETLRKNLGFEKFTILGHSWGGRLAMEYALAHPEKLNKIILISSTPATFAEHEKFGAEINRRTASIKEVVSPLFDAQKFYALDKAGLDEMYKKFFATYMANPEDISKLSLSFNVSSARSGFEVFGLMIRDAWKPNFDLTKKLANLKVPTLVIHGMQDTIPLSSAKEISSSIPNSQLITINNCGHFPYIEKPYEMFSAIDSFMSK